VRLIAQDSRALHLELFTASSFYGLFTSPSLFIFQILCTLSLEHVFLTPGNTCKWSVSRHESDICIHGCRVVRLTTGMCPLLRLSSDRSRHHRHNPRRQSAHGGPISGYPFCPYLPTNEHPLPPLHQSVHEDSSCRSVCSESLVGLIQTSGFKLVSCKVARRSSSKRPRGETNMGLFLRVVHVSQEQPVFFAAFHVPESDRCSGCLI